MTIVEIFAILTQNTMSAPKKPLPPHIRTNCKKVLTCERAPPPHEGKIVAKRPSIWRKSSEKGPLHCGRRCLIISRIEVTYIFLYIIFMNISHHNINILFFLVWYNVINFSHKLVTSAVVSCHSNDLVMNKFMDKNVSFFATQ